MLKNPEVISYLNILQEQYVMCPNDKAASNIAFICQKYWILLKAPTTDAPITDPTSHRPLTTYQPTHRPLTHRPTD